MPNKCRVALGQLINLHIRNGTRPNGIYKEWKVKEIRAALFINKEGKFLNWRNGINHPPRKDLSLILEAFFGDHPKNKAARAEFEEAYEKAASEAEAERSFKRGKPQQALPDEPQFMRLLAHVPEDLLGREPQLVEIAKHLRLFDRQVSVVILHGMRGMGKTTLAASFASANAANYPRVWSIRAETAFTAKSDLTELGQQMGWLPAGSDADRGAQTVLDYVAQNGRNLLLIYDNAPSLQSIKPLLPRSGECHVLITSNTTTWREIGFPIEITAVLPDVGGEFLCRRTKQPSSFSAAKDLSIAFGGLALGLEIVAAHCEHLDIPLVEYLANFKANPSVLLTEQRYSPIEYYGGIAISIAFEMAIDAASKLYPACAMLISYASLLPPDPVPHCLFTLGSTGLTDQKGQSFSDEDILDSVAVLRKFSLVKDASDYDGELSDRARLRYQSMQIHRLMRIVASNYGIRKGIITQSPENKLVGAIKIAFTKCGYFDSEPMEGIGYYNQLTDYVYKLKNDPEFSSKLSDEAKAYLHQNYETHVSTFNGWPH
jgi:hypothetical protein